MEFDELILHTGRAVSRPRPLARAAADRIRGGWWKDPVPWSVPGA